MYLLFGNTVRERNEWQEKLPFLSEALNEKKQQQKDNETALFSQTFFFTEYSVNTMSASV